MAARLEIKIGTYYKNETDETRPGWISLFILQHEYDISVDWLMFNKGPMFMKEKKDMETLPEKVVQPQTEKIQLSETEQKAIKDFIALKKKLPELENMMQLMGDDPELRYDMLRNFYKYQKENEK